jgi:hypothetical protein
VFKLQSTLEWNVEQVYEFIMKTRTSTLVFEQFVNQFQGSNLKQDKDMMENLKWLVNFIKISNYVSFIILYSIISQLYIHFFVAVAMWIRPLLASVSMDQAQNELIYFVEFFSFFVLNK